MTERLLAHYSEKQRQKAWERFQIVRPHLEEGVFLSCISRSTSYSLRTLQRWVKAYQQEGLIGLIPQSRSDQGLRRMNHNLHLLIEGLALKKPPLSIATIHRKVVKVAEENGWKSPSYSTVYNVIRSLDPGMKTLSHHGMKQYQETFDLIHRRESSRPNEIWLSDHTLLDIWVQNEKGKPVRPWLTVVMDDYSRAIAGYFINLKPPSAMQTALALHQAIWRKSHPKWQVCGIPEAFYTDHGSDFTSHHMEQVSIALKMRLIFSTPGKPRGRGRIERFFHTINQMFLSSLPGFIHKNEKNSTTHLLTVSQLDELLLSFITENYHERIHSTTGEKPRERWEKNGFLPHLPDSLEELDLLLLTVAKTRIVHPDGIRFQGLRYTDLTLAAYVGEEVMIRYNPRDIAEIRVYYRNRYLCRAICPELTGQSIDIKDIIRVRQKRRQELSKSIKDRTDLVNLYVSVHQKPTSIPESQQEETPVKSSEDNTSQKIKLKRYQNE